MTVRKACSWAGFLGGCIALTCTVHAYADEARLDVIADTSLQAHRAEIDLNSGASSAIRIKGNEHYMLMKFDLAPIRFWRVERATLWIHAVRAHKLRTVGLSTISADWREGEGRSTEAPGGCTFTRAVWPDTFWAGPGSDFLDVALTNGNTFVRYTDVRPQDDDWLAIDVDPDLVQAMICGDSFGLCLSDEKGQTRANNDVHSREQSGHRPYMIVAGEVLVREPPDLQPISAEPWQPAATFEAGAARARVRALQASRYEVRYRRAGDAQRESLPRHLTPHPAAPRDTQHIVIPGLEPGAEYVVEVAAVDCLGGHGEFTAARVIASPSRPLPEALEEPPTTLEDGAEPPVVGGLRTWACPAECKVNPITGNVLEEVGHAQYEGDPAGEWRKRNPVWNGRKARLFAARGEVVALKIVVDNTTQGPTHFALEHVPGDAPAMPPPALLARNWYVRDEQWFAEYMIPTPPEGASIPSADNNVPGQTCQSFTVIWETPLDAEPGLHRCGIKVGSGATHTLPVSITIRDLTIPPHTTFEVDLNCYGRVYNAPDFDEYLDWERRYYAAAHALRATLNPLPYSQSGRISEGFAPTLEGAGGDIRVADWSEYDRHYGSYLDGSAFGGVRAGVPITHMYLPHHEDWPTPIAGHYSAANDIRKYPDNIVEHAMTAPAVQVAFDRQFKDAFVAITREFVEHFAQRGWTATDMQCYQNNKYYYKDERHSFRGTSWWLLDEPMHRDDWLALGMFAQLFEEGATGARRFIYRGDISRPQWQRDWLDDLVDVICVSSELFNHPGHCRRMTDRWGATFWHYGTANAVGASNLSGEAWALRAYVAGADGILPWNTIGGDGALDNPTATALLVPGTRFGITGPVVSLRLLALCRGQQDVEYLNLLARKKGYDRDQIARLVSEFITLGGEHRKDYADDAGRVVFGRLSWEEFARLRSAVASALGCSAP